MIKISKILFYSILLGFSCQRNHREDVAQDNENLNQSKSIKYINQDTLHNLLENALEVDSLEFDHWEPFLYFKSGSILSTNEKNAILVTCPTDSTYSIALFTESHHKWKKNDEINYLEAHPLQFHLHFEDYNFDGQTDIYLQKSVSNGWALSRGYLLTIDPLTKKLYEHKETRNYANMTPNHKEKIVYTDELDYSTPFRKVNKRINQWKNGKLVSYGLDQSKD